ncbi:glycosyltransferase [Actinopolymorpha pittospori]|uniref:Glycosyltransferase involved in cell wall biosynthesis n=1 Tax=Actinopolymorpha pittospori TaxID=648752 RepID=A0A927MN11_9ACTN|nr:glycosyltransferase involved in cell wall biosynthesis [Actinopolymorpha pittospori]
MTAKPTRPRIVLTADWWWPNLVGGAEHSARDIALALADAAEVTVVIPAASSHRYPDGPLRVVAAGRRFARAHHPGSRVSRVVELLTTWLNPRSGAAMRREIRAVDPDLVVVTNTARTGPWLLRFLKRRRYRTVRVYHDLSDTCWLRSRRRNGRNCHTPCPPCGAKAAIMASVTPTGTRSVCVSHFVREDLLARGLTRPERTSVGYPALNPPDPARGIRRNRPRPERTTLGYVGRLAPVKGIEHAIDVASRFAETSRHPVTLLLAGNGDPRYVEELRTRPVHDRLRVDVRGWLPIEEFCARVDVALVPSTWLEPFGRVAVEVGMRGVPALVSPQGGLPEAAALSGTPYAFADFTDPPGAAATLADLLATSTPATTSSGAPPTTSPADAPLTPDRPPSLAQAATRAACAALATGGDIPRSTSSQGARP